jgi:hypothetical protein
MGYNSEFQGSWKLNKALDDVTYNFLKKLNETRRMKRKVDAKYGVEGEFYVEDPDNREPNIVDINGEPKTQPSLWCQWIPTECRMEIEWDGGEKFYNYIEWIEYIISKVLAPRGYILNGSVKWRGEEFDDTGVIKICDNIVNGKRLITDYSINKLLGTIGATTVKGKNTTPSVSMNKRQTGIKPDGRKTKHQIAKEKQEEAKRQLEAQIQLLETQLKEKDKELKRASEIAAKKVAAKLTVQDLMLIKIKDQSQFGGSLEDFKEMLKNLLAS